ncbi:uncharacterized protein PV09_03663 [Verruconis gallopava]|uniref:DUF1742-domain-containing protein n=1 Tax=Verruconis gallopava TaxID=253628 RepID=A0A0D1XQZ5_9PEZI|nr:uncharacterized protein PV09_03663 [Verruconis gallopava]KIW05106.1 hypothetical protein PV09_03663 [Verruconis gallopava]
MLGLLQALYACSVFHDDIGRSTQSKETKDFFYTCVGHLADPNFAIPDKDEVAALEARKKAELNAEIEKVKKEYAEKMKRKAEKRKESGKDEGSGEKSNEEEKKRTEADKVDEKERDEKIKILENSTGTPNTDGGIRIYNLHKTFYLQRLNNIRNAENAKRNLERLVALPQTPNRDPA